MLNFAAILLFIASCTDSSDTIALGEPDTDVNDTSLETGELDIVPGHIAAWSRDERAAPGSITVNEVMYNSPAGDEFEWIEL